MCFNGYYYNLRRMAYTNHYANGDSAFFFEYFCNDNPYLCLLFYDVE